MAVCGQFPLAGGSPGGVSADLRVDVESSPFGAGDRAPRGSPRAAPAQLGPPRAPSAISLGAGLALPGDERRRRGRSRGAAYSTRTGSGASARAVTRSWAPDPLGPFLGPGAHHRHVRQPRPLRRRRQEVALLADALHEPDLGLGKRRGQDEARKAPAAAEVGDDTGLPDLGPGAAPSASRRRGRRRRSPGRGRWSRRSRPPRARAVRSPAVPAAARKPVFGGQGGDPVLERRHGVKRETSSGDERRHRRGGDRARRPRCTSRRPRARAGIRGSGAARRPHIASRATARP